MIVNAYFISGLGADKRAFHKIILPPSFNVLHVDWILPKEKETLVNYSRRLAEKIDQSKPFVLIGLSFGGIIVSELSKILHPLKSIIISSAPTSAQLPWYFKLIRKLNIHKLITAKLLKSKNALTFWAFGVKTSEEKKLLSQILDDTNEDYLKWSINAILKWRNKEKPPLIFHIHGTKDRILPISYIRPDVTIRGGRHFMVVSMHEEINKIINEQLNKLI